MIGGTGKCYHAIVFAIARQTALVHGALCLVAAVGALYIKFQPGLLLRRFDHLAKHFSRRAAQLIAAAGSPQVEPYKVMRLKGGIHQHALIGQYQISALVFKDIGCQGIGPFRSGPSRGIQQ